MTSLVHLFALCVLVLFIKMLAISCYQGFFRLRHRAFSNPEDAGFFQRPAIAQELAPVSRAAKAWANDLENIPLFFVLGGLCLALDTNAAATAWLFGLFTVARVLHTLLYLGRRQPWRTLAYGVGLACLLGLAGLIGAALLPIR
ncbi:MAPEG family protein [Pseudomonas sp. WS 5059]|jgi:glutathione S-transferase|uniref:MAPEG family protein n=1 Tax=unclassified Pseudomonas TaxID=196821 RepID=UPI001474488B|nr:MULTISPECIES: MAPEG family protein [unclassified Pseudomonas]NMX66941.1 MAPEG family protein [Pseudomonas sp. WS 5111]NMY01612.1 MAPEG family protein [Pseudomonas sp. WS 5059]NMY25807.1 MAPEG family protein [Pseudomonas sp. WS 5021]